MEEIEKLIISLCSKSELLGKSKEELINLVLKLQAGNQELFASYQKLYKSKSERAKSHDKVIEDYKKKMEEYFRMYLEAQAKSEQYKKVVDLRLGNSYNIDSTWIDKIVFVLKEAGRPLRSSDIIEILERNDITFRTLANPQKGLSTHLTKALQYGRILGERQKGQNGYLFRLPESKEAEG